MSTYGIHYATFYLYFDSDIGIPDYSVTINISMIIVIVI